MPRDYCPSRHDQKKLKRKTPSVAVSRRQKARAKKSSKAKNKSVKSNNFFSILISILFLALISFLSFYLLRNFWQKRQALKTNYQLLLIDDRQAQFLLRLLPASKRVELVDLRSEANLIWESSASADLDQRLFFSLALGEFIDQLVERGDFQQFNDKLAWQQFLGNQEKFNLELTVLKYLQRHDLDWQWPESLVTNAIKAKNFACPVAVINTSQQNGLANRFATLLAADGFSIIRRDSDSQALETSRLVLDPEMIACQALSQRFSQFLPQQEIQSNFEITNKYRAGAVIFLGEDLARLDSLFTDLLHSDF